MNNVRINNEVNLTYPDGFHEMSGEELIKFFSTPDNRWGAFNSDDHIILSVSWTKAKFMTDAESLLIGIEARMRGNLLNYQRVTSIKTKIASQKALGVRFEYRVNDAALVQVGDLIVIKYKGKFYAFHFITRKSNAAPSRLVFEEILKSVTLG